MILVILLLSLFYPFFSYAQQTEKPEIKKGKSEKISKENNSKENKSVKGKESEKKKNWKSSLFLSYTMSKGNSEGAAYSGQAQFNYNIKGFTFSGSYEQYYGKNKEIVNLNKGKAFFTFNRQIKDGFNMSSSATYEYDRIAQLDYRFNYGIGFSYLKGEKTSKNFSFTTNVVYEIDDYSVPEKEDRKNFRLQMFAQTNINFLQYSYFQASFLYTPNIVEFSTDYRIEIKTSIKFLMTSPIWFKFSMLNQFNNKPPSDKIKKDDFTMVTGIELTI